MWKSQAVIASWSYPLIVAFCQLAPTLAAGRTVVLPAAGSGVAAGSGALR